MVCNPSDNSLNPPFLGPPAPVPGFGLPFSTPRLPFPDLQIPEEIPEDILNLIDSLLARLPGGILKPNPSNEMKDVWDAIANLLSQIGPFLALYNFFQALINMVLCVIDVLCALMSPFKVRRAVRRLFKRCIPNFMNLFPWIALVAMILSLILLLLALIEYIINLIISYIQDIIRNLQVLAKAVQLDDSESVVAAALKIAYLLCLIEQIFAILTAFAAIFNIIQAMISVRGRSVCGRGPSRQGDDNDCCTEDVCPAFIAENENGLFGSNGTLKYLKQRTDLLFSSFTLREESYQFYDESLGQPFTFSDIITPIDGNIFWPDSLTFDSFSSRGRIPYFLDMTILINPADLGHSDFGGLRIMHIKDIIVERRPYVGVFQFDNSVSGTQNGTLRLTGGLVYEADGITPYPAIGTQHTLNTFIKQPPAPGPLSSDDSLNIINVSYNLRINHDALVGYQLINVMCVPDVAIESLVFNTSTVGTFGIDSAGEKLGAAGGSLPDITGAVECLQSALASFRQDVSEESAAAFQASMQLCMDGLREEAEDAFVGGVVSGTSLYHSTVELEPDVQFINNPIKVIVQLKDANNVVISSNIPDNLAEQLEEKVTGSVSLGTITDFAYDRSLSGFIAEIESEAAGSGTLSVEFDGETLSTILNRDDLDAITTLQPLTNFYRFVGSVTTDGYGVIPGLDEPPKPRRDEGDVSDA